MAGAQPQPQPEPSLQPQTDSRSGPLPLPPPPTAPRAQSEGARWAPSRPVEPRNPGPAPSDEAIPAVRDERYEATDAHRLRAKRRAVIMIAAAVVVLLIVIVILLTRGPSTTSAAQRPTPPTTASTPTTPSPAPAEPQPAASADPSTATTTPDSTPSPPPTTGKKGKHTPRTTPTGTRNRTHATTAATTPAAPTAVEPLEAGAGKNLAQARTDYSHGNDLLFAGNTAGAIRAYRDAAKLGYIAGYRGLGLAYERAGDRSHARDAFQTYLRKAPKAKDAALIKKRLAALK